MTGRRPARRQPGSGKGLLLVVVLVLIAGIVRYADTPLVTAARDKAAEVLAGAPGVDKVLAVFGGDSTASEVFGAQPTDSGTDAGYAASSGGADDILGRKRRCSPTRWTKPSIPWSLSTSCPPKAR